MTEDKGNLVSDKALVKLAEPYIAKFDQKLEDILLEFEDYDYTYQALLTQAEFEEEFMPIIGKIFRRSNKYDIIYEIFDTLISRSMRDLHKLLCLIDLMINISRHDPTVFKKLPNAIMSKIAEHPVFPKIEQYVYNLGRMNYKFKRFNSVKDSSTNQDQNSDSSSDSEDESSSRYKHAHVSLAELTSKIMSQTAAKQKKQKDATKISIKKEEDDSLSPSELLNDEDESEDEKSYYSKRRSQKSKAKSGVEGLMESDSEYESEGQYDEDRIDEEEYHLDVDPTMSTVTSILEHNMDYNLMDSSALAVNKRQVDFDDSEEPYQKRRNVSRPAKKKEPKPKKPKSPVSRKTYYVIEKDLDFVFDQVFTRAPKCNSRLLKAEIKGFIYKPAQFELFSTLSENACGMSAEIAKRADEMLNAFVLQQAKRAGGCELDSTQYVHPFEYDYIIENFDKLMEQGVKLPPIIMYDRYGSMYDLEDNINKEFNIRSIKNTKVKGLIQLTPFKSEDEYFDLFKRIVPRDKVAARLSFLQRLVTDGKSIFVFDLMENILQAMRDVPRLMEDSEAEEEAMIQQELQQNLLEKDIIEAQANIEESLRVEQHGLTPSTGVEISDDGNVQNKVMLDTESEIDEGRKSLIEKMSHNISEHNSDSPVEISDKHSSNKGLSNDLAEKVTVTEELLRTDATKTALTNDDVATENSADEALNNENSSKVVSNVKDSAKSEQHENPLIEPSDVNNDTFNDHPINDPVVNQIQNTSENDAVAKEETRGETLLDTDQLATGNTEKKIEEQAIHNASSVPINKEELGKNGAIGPSNHTSEVVKPIDNNNIKKENAESSNKPDLIKSLMRVPRFKTKLRIDAIKADMRESKYVSSKGISVPIKTIKKVLSTQERFNLLALLLFPGLKLKETPEVLPNQYIRTIGYAFDGFRPYLLSLILDDQHEFLRLPKYFKVDSTMFELQVQYLKEHPGSRKSFISL